MATKTRLVGSWYKLFTQHFNTLLTSDPFLGVISCTRLAPMATLRRRRILSQVANCFRGDQSFTPSNADVIDRAYRLKYDSGVRRPQSLRYFIPNASLDDLVINPSWCILSSRNEVTKIATCGRRLRNVDCLAMLQFHYSVS